MAYSYNEVGPITSGQTIVVNFPFLSRDHVSVLVDGEVVSGTLWSWASDGLISALEGFPSGDVTRVRRRTPATALRGELTGSAVFAYRTANENFYQALYISQERADDEDERAVDVDDLRDELESQQTDLDASVELGRKWATEDEDVVVAGGAYSARHHALKAQDWSQVAEGFAEDAEESAEAIDGAVGSLEAATAVIAALGFFGDWGFEENTIGATQDWGFEV